MPDGTPVVGSPTDPGRSARIAEFWERNGSWLAGRSVLDVGCDRRHLAPFVLDSGGAYWGVGLGGTPDQEVDLEVGGLPFSDGAFDAVVCLDVLEHLEAAHAVFDELCRTAASIVIVSLPGPWAELYRVLRFGPYRADLWLKYYGLPAERPSDRHHWFFPAADGPAFVVARARAAGFDVVDVQTLGRRSRLKHPLRTAAEWVLFRRGGLVEQLYAGPTTVVLRRQTRPVPAPER